MLNTKVLTISIKLMVPCTPTKKTQPLSLMVSGTYCLDDSSGSVAYGNTYEQH